MRTFLGIICLCLGIIGGLLPFIQGWIFIILGLLLLKKDIPFIRRLSLWIKRKYPKMRPIFSKAEQGLNNTLKRWPFLR